MTTMAPIKVMMPTGYLRIVPQAHELDQPPDRRGAGARSGPRSSRLGVFPGLVWRSVCTHPNAEVWARVRPCRAQGSRPIGGRAGSFVP